MKYVFRFALLLSLATVFVFSPSVGYAKNIKPVKKIVGSLLTNNAGSSLAQPPYIQVMRSKAGLEYLIRQFEKIPNRITRKRVGKLKASLVSVNFKKYMLIGVISQPMDNFKMKFVKAKLNNKTKVANIDISYLHKMRNLRIPPKKSIHYMFLVLPKSDGPVVLNATQLMVKSKRKKAPPAKVITVTGRLMPLVDNDLQLVPVVIRRGKKSSYYIRGKQAADLAKHIGKVVTLKGSVSHERNGPYEWELTLEKVVKVFD